MEDDFLSDRNVEELEDEANGIFVVFLQMKFQIPSERRMIKWPSSTFKSRKSKKLSR
jgi:hypothetical protein